MQSLLRAILKMTFLKSLKNPLTGIHFLEGQIF